MDFKTGYFIMDSVYESIKHIQIQHLVVIQVLSLISTALFFFVSIHIEKSSTKTGKPKNITLKIMVITLLANVIFGAILIHITKKDSTEPLDIPKITEIKKEKEIVLKQIAKDSNIAVDDVSLDNVSPVVKGGYLETSELKYVVYGKNALYEYPKGAKLIYKVTQKNNKTTLTKIKKLPIEVSKDRQWELPIKNPNQTYEIQRNLSDVTFVFIFNFVLLIMFFVYFANWCKSVFNNKIIKL